MLNALESVAAAREKLHKVEEEWSRLHTATLKLRESALAALTRPAGGRHSVQGSASQRREERGQHGERLNRPTTTPPRAQTFSTALANFSSENDGEIVYSDLGLFHA